MKVRLIVVVGFALLVALPGCSSRAGNCCPPCVGAARVYLDGRELSPQESTREAARSRCSCYMYGQSYPCGAIACIPTSMYGWYTRYLCQNNQSWYDMGDSWKCP